MYLGPSHLITTLLPAPGSRDSPLRRSDGRKSGAGSGFASLRGEAPGFEVERKPTCHRDASRVPGFNNFDTRKTFPELSKIEASFFTFIMRLHPSLLPETLAETERGSPAFSLVSLEFEPALQICKVRPIHEHRLGQCHRDLLAYGNESDEYLISKLI